MADKHFALEIIREIAKEIDAKFIVEPEYQDAAQLVFKNGKKVFLSTRSFNINKSISDKVATDKDYTNFFLKQYGYNVPEESTVYSDTLCKRMGYGKDIDSGYQFAQKLGFPVIIKPNNLAKGELVTKVYGKKDYYSVAKKIFKKTSIMLVQKYHVGRDFRILVFNGKVIFAYERIRLNVVGDGASTLGQLIHKKQESIDKAGRNVYIDIDDFRLKDKIKRQKLTMNSVIAKGEAIYLLDNANLSSGGDSEDFSDRIHPDFCKLAINVTKDMDLTMCGVDILTSDITKPLDKNDYVIIEINSKPGVSNFSTIGDHQSQRIKELYREVINLLKMSN